MAGWAFLVLWCLLFGVIQSSHVPSFMFEQMPPAPMPVIAPRLAAVPRLSPFQLVSNSKQTDEQKERLAVVTETVTVDNRDAKAIEPLKNTQMVDIESKADTRQLLDAEHSTNLAAILIKDVNENELAKVSVPSTLDGTKVSATAVNSIASRSPNNMNNSANASTDAFYNTTDTDNAAVSVANVQVSDKVAEVATNGLATKTGSDKAVSVNTILATTATPVANTNTVENLAVASNTVPSSSNISTETKATSVSTKSSEASALPGIMVSSSAASTSPHSAVITITITTTNGGTITALPTSSSSSSSSSSTLPIAEFKQRLEGATPSSSSAKLSTESVSNSLNLNKQNSIDIPSPPPLPPTLEQSEGQEKQTVQPQEQAPEPSQAEQEHDDFAQARALETRNQARGLAQSSAAAAAGAAAEFGPGDPTLFSRLGGVSTPRSAYLAGQGLLSPYPGLPLSRPRRSPRYSTPPFHSVEDYRLFKEAQKQGLIAPADPLRSPFPNQPLYPSEPFGAWGNADFVGDNMVTRPFEAAAGNAQMGKLSSLKTTPGISCDSWRSCSECLRFSFCTWNDEGQSCRQEIDVIFSAVHQKYSKKCSLAGPREEYSGPRRDRETPAMFPDVTPSSFSQGSVSDMFEPPYSRRERIRSGLARDLQVGQMEGLWRAPQEYVNWFAPDAPASMRQTPELRFRQKPLIEPALLDAKPVQTALVEKGHTTHLVHQDPPRFMSTARTA